MTTATKLGAILAAALALPLAATPAAQPAAPTGVVTKSCGGEAGPEFFPCAYDARHEGDGKGHSYVVGRDGHGIRVPHIYAHRLRGK